MAHTMLTTEFMDDAYRKNADTGKKYCTLKLCGVSEAFDDANRLSSCTNSFAFLEGFVM